jgi:hypothetical protein|eukprot:scaffold1133_cov294-Chaetoceros_neogracile.AAC.5
MILLWPTGNNVSIAVTTVLLAAFGVNGFTDSFVNRSIRRTELSGANGGHHHDNTNNNNTNNNNKKFFTSKKEQEDLWESNALYFNNQEQATPTKHITTNTWPRSSRGRKLRKRAARPWIHGVEIRELKSPHPLAGLEQMQLGLFAANSFQQCDIIGEYCGEVFDADDGGEYATYLEYRDEKYALGVDAQQEGNECRFINHYQGISEKPNVIMKIGYVEELPRVMIVCIRDINVGEELLLQYSDEYVQEYIG